MTIYIYLHLLLYPAFWVSSPGEIWVGRIGGVGRKDKSRGCLIVELGQW